MLKVRTQQFLGYSREEVWFSSCEEPESNASGSNSLFYQSQSPPAKSDIPHSTFSTLVIDLDQPMESIVGAFKKNYRNEIRRAEKLDISFEVYQSDSPADFDDYLTSQKEWSASRDRGESSKRRMKSFFDSDHGCVAVAKLNQQPLVYHFYIFDAVRARLLTSHNTQNDVDEKTIGFANKYLHFSAINHFHSKSFKIYDLGGVDFEKTPGIAKFKTGFGGTIESSYDFQISSSFHKRIKNLKRLVQRKS